MYKMTAVIEKEDDMYVAWCPQVDVVSQGYTIEEARENLQEALELFFEHASKSEITLRLKEDVFITQVEVALA